MGDDSKAKRAAGPQTLAIDVGGTGLKALVLDARGAPLTERVRVETPRPATPAAILRALRSLVSTLGSFDRVSVGFPGVVVDGVTKTAPNLHPRWTGFPLAKKLELILKKPVRVANDAGVQGLGDVEGRGVEMVITLGTGMGCALFLDGKYVPNLELAHHPFHKDKTYEDYVGMKAFEKVGKKKWNHHVAKVLEQIQPIWNPRKIFLGGGNAKHLTITLPPNVKVTSNVAGLLGGIRLWDDSPTSRLPKS
jgi:polyphosphate glucokinase